MKRSVLQERWSITIAGERYLRRRKEQRRKKQYSKHNVRVVPVYRLPERKDGKPSINTLEGWEALRQRLINESRVSKET